MYTTEELTKILDEAQTPITYDGDSWDQVYAGNVRFKLPNGWIVVVFNDCSSWDYVDEMISPSGERIELSSDIRDDVFNWIPEDYSLWGLTDENFGPCQELKS